MSDPRVELLQVYEEARSRRAEGNITGAFARYRRVLEAAESSGDLPWQAELLFEIGQMYQDAFELLEARRWYGRALSLFRELGQERDAGLTLLRQAQTEQLSGSTTDAESLFREALASLSGAGDPRDQGLVRAGLGHLLWEMKREPEGAEELVAGMILLRDAGAPETPQVVERIRGWRGRLGPFRYRRLVEEVTEDPDLRKLLL